MQVHADVSRSQRGLGLGLSIVQQLVEAMGGAITASSTVGSGTTFTFSLPLYTPAAAAAAAAAAAPEGAIEEDELAASAITGAAGTATAGRSPGVGAASSAGGGTGQRRLLTDRQAVLAMGSAAVGASYSAAVASGGGGRRGSAPAVGAADMSSLAAEFAGLAAGFGGSQRSSSRPQTGGSSPAVPGWDNNMQEDAAAADEDQLEGWALQQPLASPLAGRRSDVARVLADEQEAALAALPEMMMRAGGGAGVMSRAVPRPRSSIPATQFHSQARGGRVQLLVVDDDTVNHQVGSCQARGSSALLLYAMCWFPLCVLQGMCQRRYCWSKSRLCSSFALACCWPKSMFRITIFLHMVVDDDTVNHQVGL
jgi:hypothetical protein